jgi:hypothetical protein
MPSRVSLSLNAGLRRRMMRSKVASRAPKSRDIGM